MSTQTFELELPLAAAKEQALERLQQLEFPCKIWVRINTATSKPKSGKVFKSPAVPFMKSDATLLTPLFNHVESLIPSDAKPVAALLMVEPMEKKKTRQCPSCEEEVDYINFMRHVRACSKGKCCTRCLTIVDDMEEHKKTCQTHYKKRKVDEPREVPTSSSARTAPNSSSPLEMEEAVEGRFRRITLYPPTSALEGLWAGYFF